MAVFNTKSSWKDLDGLSDALKAKILAHEQGHFDLAEVFRRRWQKAADEVAMKLTAEQRQRTARAVPERNRAVAQDTLKQELAEGLKKELQELEKLRLQLLHELSEAEDAYDKYTNHGGEDVPQAEWTKWIAGQLSATPPADPPPGTKKK